LTLMEVIWGMDSMGVTHVDRGSRGVTIEQRLKE